MKVNRAALMMVLSMGNMDMFSMLHDLDSVDQLMAEWHYNYNETLDELQNGEHVTTGNTAIKMMMIINILEKMRKAKPPPHLTGWEWLTG